MGYDNPVKRTVSEAVRVPRSQRVIDRLIMLPSVNMLDFRYLVSQGYITEKTGGILVEKIPSYARRIQQYLETYGYKNFIVHTGRLETLNLAPYVALGHTFDYIDLDTCGLWNQRLYSWIKSQLQPGLGRTYDFALTVTATNRAGVKYPLYGQMREELRLTYFNKWILENNYGEPTASDCREDVIFGLHDALGINPDKNAINAVGYRAQKNNMIVYKACKEDGKVKIRKPFDLPNFKGCYCIAPGQADKMRQRMIELCRSTAPLSSCRNQCHPLARP